MTNLNDLSEQADAAVSAARAQYLADNPAMTCRDWPGSGLAPFDKTFVAPGAPDWDQLDMARVRYVATSTPARFMSKAERQAAARDSKLVWDEATRIYRRVGKGLGGPQSTVSAASVSADPDDAQRAYALRSAGSEADREVPGGAESFGPCVSKTGAGQ